MDYQGGLRHRYLIYLMNAFLVTFINCCLGIESVTCFGYVWKFLMINMVFMIFTIMKSEGWQKVPNWRNWLIYFQSSPNRYFPHCKSIVVTIGEELTLWIDLLNQPLVHHAVFQVCETFYIKYRTKTGKKYKNEDSDSLYELKKYKLNFLQYSKQRNKRSGSRKSALKFFLQSYHA